MPFQFYCPNGHLLQANEDQIGQSCVCPHCQVEIIIPAPAGYTPSTPASPPNSPASQPPVSTLTGFNSQNNSGNSAPPNALNFQKKKKKFNFGAAQEAENAAQKPTQKMNIGDPEEDSRLHCLCPTGHPLEINRDMVGQKAMCPYCQKTFVITLERTVEYINKKKRAEELEDKKMAKFWFQWAIVAIVLAVIFIVVMIILGVSH